MHPVLSTILGSMQSDLAAMDRVAMNLANVQTPGFKRSLPPAVGFAVRLDAAAANAGAKAGTAPSATRRVGTNIDLSPGTLKSTGQSLDVAITGPGWFEVQTAHGPAYTRKGDFRLDGEGRLATQGGDLVMGTSGSIQLASGAASVDATGRVFDPVVAVGGSSASAGALAGQIKLVQFDASAQMLPVGDGVFLAEGEPTLVPEGAARLQQGFLENSNVSHTGEMVQLVHVLRHMETLQKVAVGYDEMLASTIRRLGDTS